MRPILKERGAPSEHLAETDLSRVMDQSQRAINKLPIDDPHLLSGDYWGELRIFLAVAKAKSFNRAADELGLSRPTVSAKVRRLQDLLRAQLLVSSKSGISLTQKGKELADRLLALDQSLFAISRDLRGDTREAEGHVTITCTEALAGFFIVPALKKFSEQYPKIHFHLRNPVSLINFRENQSDIFVGLGSLNQDGIESKPAGFLHLIGVASRAYLARHGQPTRANLKSHLFVEAGYYASRTPTYESWHNAVDQGTIAHQCDNSFVYGLLVKDGGGIGLLANYTLVDPDMVPIGLDIHSRFPIYIHALTERLGDRPVRIAFDLLDEVFSPTNPVFSPKLILDAFEREPLMALADRILIDSQLEARHVRRAKRS